MLLAAGPLPDVLKFMQILGWIILPILGTTVLITIFFHRRRKNVSPEDNSILPDVTSSETFGYTNDKGELVILDHSKLVKDYRKRLSTEIAKCMAVQNDLSLIKEKYSATARYARILYLTHKNQTMENLENQLPEQFGDEINRIANENTREKKELLSRIDKYQQISEKLERENLSLKEQLQLACSTDDEKMNSLKKWMEENNHLKEKLSTLEYLSDVVDEKNAQIGFLQQQLDLRVKNFHQAEQGRNAAVSELERLRPESQEYADKVTLLYAELQQLRDIEGRLRQLEAELQEKEQLLSAGTGEVSYLKSLLNESKQQNEIIDAALADAKEREAGLIERLEEAQSHNHHLEQHLQSNKQLFRRVYRELSLVVNNDDEGSVVIPISAGLGETYNV